jgi:hypothetical protein
MAFSLHVHERSGKFLNLWREPLNPVLFAPLGSVAVF